MPEDKFVILGLVSTKSGKMESLADLLRRVENASRYIERARLGISPQCGFASSVIGNAIVPAEQQRKLELVARAAAAIWA